MPFFYDSRIERAVATNLYTGLQASYLARSGVALAEVLLRADLQAENDNTQPRGVDYAGDIWASVNSVPIGLGGGSVSIVVVDEQSKLNLNRLATNNLEQQKRWGGYLERLLHVRGQDPALAYDLVEALIDWVDADQTPTGSGGAEAPYYLGLTPPYSPANRPLATVEELRLVKGWTPEVVEAVAPFVTVYGSGAININTARLEVLQAVGLDESQARAVLEYRERGPVKSRNEIRDIRGLSSASAEIFEVRSDIFSVVATAGFRESRAVVRAVLQRGGQGAGGGTRRLYWRAE